MSYSSTHKKLVKACQRGKREAQFELYSLYETAMYNLCFRMLGSRSDAEDTLQEAFIDVFTKLHSFRFESSIGAWIKRIVINRCLNALKRRKVQWVELEEWSVGASEEVHVSEKDTEVAVQKIQAAITRLSDGYRVVFTLYCMEGYSHKEIASILDISESTSKSQLNRAKRQLREYLGDRSAAYV